MEKDEVTRIFIDFICVAKAFWAIFAQLASAHAHKGRM